MISDSSAVGSASVEPKAPALLEALGGYVRASLVVAEIEVRKLRHDPMELGTRAIQPLLWLLVFGEAMSRLRAIPSGGVPYLTFMAPGILAQSLMFVSIFYGLSIIWDRDAGILQKFLVLPVPRAAFVTGRGLGAGVRALSQAVIVLLLSLIVGVHFRWTAVGVAMSLLTVFVGAGIFATVSMLIAIVVKTRERFMGIGQVITMPLFFASNAIYPITIMPAWLRILAQGNPLTYVVELLRGYLLAGTVPDALLAWGVLAAVLVVLQTVAALSYHKVLL